MKFKKFLRITILLIFVLTISFLLIDFASKNQSLEDSSALFGGKLESGYPYAGYLIAVEPNNKVTTCGISFIEKNIALTAAHCIVKDASIYLGVGEFKLSLRSNFEIEFAEQNPEWNSKTYKDIAIIKLKDEVYELEELATTTSPKSGCNYVIVGYGMNEDSVSGSLNNKKRKSTEICIEDILADEVFFQGSGGGICYGDSGSPVFEKGTNRLMGVVSSILVPDNFIGTNYCSINNRGVIVRVDDNSNFISQFRDKVAAQGCSGTNCIALEGQSCSLTSGISCSLGLTCSNSLCVKSTEIPSLNISTEIVASTDSQKSIIETISESFNIDFSTSQGALLGITLLLLAIVIILLFKFLFF